MSAWSLKRAVLSSLLMMLILPVTTRSDDKRPAWSAPALEHSISVRRGANDERITFETMIRELGQADAVFLGESHNDETTHRFELAVYDRLIKNRKNVVLAMEMFERDVQSQLDDYLAGNIDENEFRSSSRPWGNYQTAYRPLIERARQAGLPVIASNFPRPLRMRIAREGSDILQHLSAQEQPQSPRKFLPNTDAYWRRVDNAIRSHAAMMRGSDDGDDRRLYSTQSLWDNSMGEACADALDKFEGSVVVHVNGGFHSAYWDGTVHQLKSRKPHVKVATVAVTPVTNPSTARVTGKPMADYVVFAESRASDLNEGTWSVSVRGGIDYKLHMPSQASDSQPVPLLIWLSDDGMNAQDGLDLWKDRLGSVAAIAVVQAPFRETQADFGVGGRWYWSDSFMSDSATMVTAVERIWGYVSRHFPVDPERVCVAGEGTGATVAIVTALMSDRFPVSAVAVAPRQYQKVKDFSLPLPQLRGDDPLPSKSVQILGTNTDLEWWTPELQQYIEVGLPSKCELQADQPWERERSEEEMLRAALGLLPLPPVESDSPALVVLQSDSPKARHWARLHALRIARRDNIPVAVTASPPSDSSVRQIPAIIHPTAFGESGALPRCPGPFGGTTVLVLPDELDQATVDAWMQLEENDPLAAHSRFHRVRIATLDGAHRLADVLTKLKSEGRMNILIAPATFCADEAQMRSIKKQTLAFDDEMTLHWKPGLGGQKITIAGQTDSGLPIRHTLTVTLHPESHVLQVQDDVDLDASRAKAGTEFALNRQLIIESSQPKLDPLPGEKDERLRHYRLAADAPNGKVVLHYAGPMAFGLSDQKEEYTRGFRQTAGTVGTEGVYLDGNSGWVPQFNEDLIRFQLEVHVPDQWHVISQGEGSSRDESGVARWDSQGPVEQVYLVGGPMKKYQETAGAVETLVYLHEEDDGLARKYLDATARYLEMYRGLIGPYPYGKFALVENFWETGYGMPSFTLLGPQVIRFPFILHSSYPHEILHNWWGNSVFVDYDAGNWCEGLTAYLADHLVQEQRGQGADYRRTTLQKYRNYVQEDRDFPLTEFHSRHNAATEAVGYGKALMTFHMLRRQLGDDLFRRGLADLYRKQRGKRAGFDDLRASFEAVSDQRLDWFFQQWTERVGAPILSLADVHMTRADEQYIVSGTVQQTQSGEPYQITIPFVVQSTEGTVEFQVESATAEQPFELRLDAPPLSLHVDPKFDLFRLLDPRETPSSIGQIFGEPEVLAVLPGAATEAERQTYRDLIEAWQSDQHEIKFVIDTELDQLPDDKALWFLGRNNRFAPALLDGLHGPDDSTTGGVHLGEQTVPFADHCVVVVRRHPLNIEKAVGFLYADAEAAIPGLARKLPHYGKYSYLAFEGNEPTNMAKGQWNSGRSPLRADLRSDQGSEPKSLDQPERAALAELPPVFSSQKLKTYVDWLAAPQREGRGLGSAGLQASAEFIAKQMAEAGLQPAGDNGGWLQKFRVPQGADGKAVDTYNVVGVLPGTNEAWQDQSVVLGAHFDHLGRGWPDVRSGFENQIHPGADDNASGVAVLLELARTLAAQQGNSRNLVFVAFSAEECGRLGSEFYVQHPRYPVEQIRAMINLDTVGRLGDGKIAVHGTATADEWQHIFRGCGFVTGIPNQIVPEGDDASDQLSFVAAGVPAVQIFTGAHGDYHRPSDTADRVDVPGLVKVATFVQEAVHYLSEREPPMTVRIGHGSAAPAAMATHPATGRNVLFGTVPDFAFAGPGVRIESLVADSPAASSSLKAGDILTKLDGKPLTDLRAFSNALKKLEPGQTVKVEYQRGATTGTTSVTVRQR